MKSTFLTFMFFSLISSTVGAESLQLVDVHIKDVDHEEHQDAEFCREFLTTDEQAALFFSKSKVIAPEEVHFYMWLPCWVKGKAQLGGRQVSWTIRAGGTAIIESEGKLIYVADESQLDTD